MQRQQSKATSRGPLFEKRPRSGRNRKKKCTAQEPERKGDFKRHHRMTTSDEARRRRAALDSGGAPPPTHIKQHIRNDLNFAKDGTAQQRERNFTSTSITKIEGAARRAALESGGQRTKCGALRRAAGHSRTCYKSCTAQQPQPLSPQNRAPRRDATLQAREG